MPTRDGRKGIYEACGGTDALVTSGETYPCRMTTPDQPWTEPMPAEQFSRMREILAAPSPIGLESAMTRGVLEPYVRSFMPKEWAVHAYRGNAGLVFDTRPGDDDAFSVMVIGHADKIRLQVRSIGDDGKIWINSDSFLSGVLIGHEVTLFSEDPEASGRWRALDGGTIEAVGAAHFATPEMRAGKSGIRADMLFLELQVHGEKRKDQVEALGIRPGDPILLKRPIRRGFAEDTFYGAYLDNGLGCFLVVEVLNLIAQCGGLRNVRVLGAAAAHEEIGRMGSRVLAQQHAPDVVISVDVSHDFEAAPGVGDRRMTPTAMAKGFTLAHGSITNAYLNSLIAKVAAEQGIPYQMNVVGRDTGNDAMAAVFAGVDAAATAIGFPIRYMHTISETGHTGDILAATHAVFETLRHMDAMHDGAGIRADDLRAGHPRLDEASALRSAT